MVEWIIALLIAGGGFFILIAALGVVFLPDLYMRMHAITKASSLALVLFLLAVIIRYPQPGPIILSLILLFFTVATAPIAAHVIARVACMMKVPMAEGCVVDEATEDGLFDNIHDSGSAET